jgi:hypothetical protein
MNIEIRHADCDRTFTLEGVDSVEQAENGIRVFRAQNGMRYTNYELVGEC